MDIESWLNWGITKWLCGDDSTESSFNVSTFVIWLAPWEGKMNEILRCDWLPERTSWSYLSRLARNISPQWIRYWSSFFGQDGWILASFFCVCVCVFFFFASLWTSTHLGSWARKILTWPIYSHLDLTLGLAFVWIANPLSSTRTSLKRKTPQVSSWKDQT